MKVVFDSSVLIAAQITVGGACAEAVRIALGEHDVFGSDAIFDEFQRKLTRKLNFPPLTAKLLRDRLAALMTFVTPMHVPEGAIRDPSDKPILGTAHAAQCDILVTMDKDLLSRVTYQSAAIIKPGEFLKRVRAISSSDPKSDDDD
jgi:putative PIN family toxin of toxin-antitoxin system